MGAYILKRLLLVIPTLLGIMIVNFALIQFVPGGPIDQIIAQMEGGGDVFEGISGGGSEITESGESDFIGGRGLPADFIQRVRDGLPAHVGLGVDASGEPLEHAVRAGCDLIKPNHHELAALLGRSIDTLGDVVDAALEVQRDGVATVVVSLGSRGALLVSDDGVTFGYAPAESVKNTVGAGDAFFAGFLAAGGSGSKSLSEALAWGRAAVSSASTAFPPATDTDRAAVVISSEIDRALQMEQ